MTTDFLDLCRAYHVRPDTRGEAHIVCPECGREPGLRGNVHFSFSERGAYCFCCGHSISLRKLALLVGIDPPLEQPRERQPHRREAPGWLRQPPEWRIDLVNSYHLAPGRAEAWSAYRPALPEAWQLKARLGLGELPACRCHHPRLIVPVTDHGAIVGLRGRRIDCDCDVKWTAAGGTTLSALPLYGQGQLSKAAGREVWIVENCPDALLISALTPGIGLACYSVTYWRDEWAKALAVARPAKVIIALDNDPPGNGGDAVTRAAWVVAHPGMRPTRPAGPELVKRLRPWGLDARLYPWPEGVKDMGELLGGKHAV